MAIQRQTRQQTTIRGVIAEAGAPIAPREILTRARRQVKGLGLATVYRALKRLAEAGEVKVVEIPGEPPRYEAAGKAHHHHFSCRGCGKVYEIDGCCGHFEEHLPRGFVVEDHEVVLFGRCVSCAGKG